MYHVFDQGHDQYHTETCLGETEIPRRALFISSRMMTTTKTARVHHCVKEQCLTGQPCHKKVLVSASTLT